MRVVCYTCPHGLVPGPYAEWTEEHQAEHQWLLDVCAGPLGASHVVLPTEAFARRNNGYSHDKLLWLALEARERGMTPVVWADKWLYARDEREVTAWLGAAHDATAAADPCWLLVSEGDLLWQLHPMSQDTVLRALVVGKLVLLERGVSPARIWAGGATVAGTLAVDRALCPGVLTWTAWRAIQRGLAAEGQQAVYSEVLADLGAIRRERLHPAGQLAVIELGWSVANGGEQVQAAVVEQACAAARDIGAAPGLWTVISWPHDRRNQTEREYGILDAAGQPRPALAEWRREDGAPGPRTIRAVPQNHQG